jgi:hypothetical protein
MLGQGHGSKALRVFAALVVVLSALGPGFGPASMTDTASAEWVDCSLSDSLIGAAYNTIVGATNDCRWESGTAADYANVTATDAYASALALKDSTESYTTTVANFQANSRSVAYSKAKISVVRSLENGSGANVMSNNANQTTRDYYSRQIASVLTDWNAKAEQIDHLSSTPLQHSIIDDGTDTGNLFRTEQGNYTLPNGTQHPVTVLVGHHTGGYFGIAPVDLGSSRDADSKWVTATDPSGSNTVRVLDGDAHGNLIREAENQSQQVQANMWQYAQGVESQYQAGELNATTMYQNDPTLLAQEASTSFNSTGYYGYAAVQLASIGYSGDLNQSHVVEVGGANYTGTLFFSDAGTTFNTGQSYDFENVSGSVYMAVSDGPNNASGIVRLDHRGTSFVIHEATNTKTGEAVTTTTPQRYVYQTADATALSSEIDRLQELRTVYEEQATNAGTGINLGTEDKAIVAGAVLVLLLLLTRN